MIFKLFLITLSVIIPSTAAITPGQVASAYSGVGGNISVSFSSTPTTGNIVLVSCGTDSNASAPTVADNQSNNYTVKIHTPNATVGITSAIAPIVTASGTFTVTCTQTGFTVLSTILIREYSGSSITVDKVAGAVTSTGGNAPPDNISSGNTATTTVANELIVGMSLTDDATTGAVGTGFSNFVKSSSNPRVMMVEDKTVSSTGTYAAIFSIAIFQNGAVNVLTLKEAVVSVVRHGVMVIQ